jgi:hypothetical protein
MPIRRHGSSWGDCRYWVLDRVYRLGVMLKAAAAMEEEDKRENKETEG